MLVDLEMFKCGTCGHVRTYGFASGLKSEERTQTAQIKCEGRCHKVTQHIYTGRNITKDWRTLRAEAAATA